VIGLAIYNAHTLNIALAGAVYRKLLAQPVGLEDLKDVDPEMHHSLTALLAYPAERVEADMGLTYQVRVCVSPLRWYYTAADVARATRISLQLLHVRQVPEQGALRCHHKLTGVWHAQPAAE
jgi:HECT-domain (ubiquitin-transferase)